MKTSSSTSNLSGLISTSLAYGTRSDIDDTNASSDEDGSTEKKPASIGNMEQLLSQNDGLNTIGASTDDGPRIKGTKPLDLTTKAWNTNWSTVTVATNKNRNRKLNHCHVMSITQTNEWHSNNLHTMFYMSYAVMRVSLIGWTHFINSFVAKGPSYFDSVLIEKMNRTRIEFILIYKTIFEQNHSKIEQCCFIFH